MVFSSQYTAKKTENKLKIIFDEIVIKIYIKAPFVKFICTVSAEPHQKTVNRH